MSKFLFTRKHLIINYLKKILNLNILFKKKKEINWLYAFITKYCQSIIDAGMSSS